MFNNPDQEMTNTVLAKITKMVGLAACANKEMLKNNITNVCVGSGEHPTQHNNFNFSDFQNQGGTFNAFNIGRA